MNHRETIVFPVARKDKERDSHAHQPKDRRAVPSFDVRELSPLFFYRAIIRLRYNVTRDKVRQCMYTYIERRVQIQTYFGGLLVAVDTRSFAARSTSKNALLLGAKQQTYHGEK